MAQVFSLGTIERLQAAVLETNLELLKKRAKEITQEQVHGG
jgi:hypothetical protein